MVPFVIFYKITSFSQCETVSLMLNPKVGRTTGYCLSVTVNSIYEQLLLHLMAFISIDKWVVLAAIIIYINF
jgi:hypothetical protein